MIINNDREVSKVRLCSRGLDTVYVRNSKGDIVVCAWTTDQYIGNLHENSFYEIYHGEKAEALRNRLAAGDYSKCMKNHCPYCMKGNVEDLIVEIDEVPQYPSSLYLSFENVCNYNCPSCVVNCMMQEDKKRDVEEDYKFIVDRIMPIMPHVKKISANGLGELFASKHTLELLSKWEPLAPKEEISVSLETNGSLFNEKNWKKIENLGQYNLYVSVTVMSFDEHIYQVLSGTTLPISNIENNLRFIKSLRDKGLINTLELCTVVQERNFRTLPELTRRFIEEFGADVVRLRPYTPWGRYDLSIEWFADVRNPYHPYYNEFREVMKNPIFKHPKVNDWSGGTNSELGQHPWKRDLDRAGRKMKALEKIVSEVPMIMEKLNSFVGENEELVLYGLGPVGRSLLATIKNKLNIKCIIDRFSNEKEYDGIRIQRLEDEDSCIEKNDKILVCIMEDNIGVDRYMSENNISKQNYIYVDELLGV